MQGNLYRYTGRPNFDFLKASHLVKIVAVYCTADASPVALAVFDLMSLGFVVKY